MIILGIGFLYLGVIGFSKPQLLYILTNSIQRLIVINKKTGDTIFEYKSKQSESNKLFFNGLLQGLNQISRDALDHGNLQKIKLEKGIISLRITEELYIGMLINQNSNYLRNIFSQFAFECQKIWNKTKRSDKDDDIIEITLLFNDFFHIKT